MILKEFSDLNDSVGSFFCLVAPSLPSVHQHSTAEVGEEVLSLFWEFLTDLLFPWEKQKCLHASISISELGQRSVPWSHP